MSTQQVQVSFVYTPDDPDPAHDMGVSTKEYEQVAELLMESLGAEDLQFKRLPPRASSEASWRRKRTSGD